MSRKILFFFLSLWMSSSAFSQSELTGFKVNCLRDAYVSEDLIYLDRIVSDTVVGDTLKIIVAAWADCVYEESSGYYKYHGDTLRLYYALKKSESGIVFKSMCDCPFEFSYKIKGLTHIPKTVLLNDSVIVYKPDMFKTFRVQYTILDNDTINLSDKHGLMQGRWIFLKEDTLDWQGKKMFVRIVYDQVYLNNEVSYGSTTLFDTNYKLLSVFRRNRDGSGDKYIFDDEGNVVKHDRVK